MMRASNTDPNSCRQFSLRHLRILLKKTKDAEIRIFLYFGTRTAHSMIVLGWRKRHGGNEPC